MSDLTDTFTNALELFEEMHLSDEAVMAGLEKIIKVVREGRAKRTALASIVVASSVAH